MYIVVVIVIVVAAATVGFKKRRGRMEVINDITSLKRNKNNDQSIVIYLFTSFIVLQVHTRKNYH